MIHPDSTTYELVTAWECSEVQYKSSFFTVFGIFSFLEDRSVVNHPHRWEQRQKQLMRRLGVGGVLQHEFQLLHLLRVA